MMSCAKFWTIRRSCLDCVTDFKASHNVASEFVNTGGLSWAFARALFRIGPGQRQQPTKRYDQVGGSPQRKQEACVQDELSGKWRVEADGRRSGCSAPHSCSTCRAEDVRD